MKILNSAAALTVAAISFCASNAFAAAGDLDSGFGSAGIVETQVMGFSGEAHAITHDSVGRLVVAGYSYNEDLGTSVIVIARLLSDGSLDTSFGDTGTGFVTATPPGGLAAGTYGFAIAIDSKDRIVVGGDFGVNGPGDLPTEIFTVARYLPSGLLDSSFGGSGIVETLIEPGESQSVVESLTIDSRDRVVATGETEGASVEGVLVRYKEDGGLDHSFAGGGIVTETHDGSFTPTNVRIDSTGRIIVLGTDFDPSSPFGQVSVVARYLDDGKLDVTFGSESPGFSEASDVIAEGLLLDSADDVLIAGAALSDSTLMLERMDSSGLLDTSFGIEGVANSPALVSTFMPADMKWDSHGNIIVGTTVDASFAALRFGSDGTLDESFGNDGVAIGPTSSSTSYFASAITVDDGDHFTMSGWSSDGVIESFVVARFDN
jgi:uncharacterized delta-60 repeat protein